MKKLALLILMILVAFPVLAAKKPKPVTVTESVDLNVNVLGTPVVEITNTFPVPVSLVTPPDTDVMFLEGECFSPCYGEWEEIGWLNDTPDKVLVLTDFIFTNAGGTGDSRLRASVTVWNPPYDYQAHDQADRAAAFRVRVPKDETRSIHLQTGLRVYPDQWLAIPMFEGAGSGFVAVTGRLEDL